MALPSSLGTYITWDSTDILNRFADGCRPTVEDWESIRQYLFPMLTQTEAQSLYGNEFKAVYNNSIIQNNVLDHEFFLLLFDLIQFNNFPFHARYINANSPYFDATSELNIYNAFADGAKPNGTIFAGYLQALLSPTAFVQNNACGFAIQDTYGSSWMSDYVIQASIEMSTTPNVRAHSIANTVYNAIGRQVSGRPFTIMMPKTCLCTNPLTYVNINLTLICNGRITDVGQDILNQTEIHGLVNTELRIPKITQQNASQFTMTFTATNVQPLFIESAFSVDAISEGIATVHIVCA